MLRRRIFNFCSWVSLLLCLSVCVLWVRSYSLMEKITWQSVNGYRSIETAQGYLEIGLFLAPGSSRPADSFGPRYSNDRATGPFNGLVFLWLDPPVTDISWEHAGFAWYERREGLTGYVHAIGVVPFWFIAAGTALLPLMWTLRQVRSRRLKKQGHCTVCGYDLRATPQRCPECGTETGQELPLPSE